MFQAKLANKKFSQGLEMLENIKAIKIGLVGLESKEKNCKIHKKKNINKILYLKLYYSYQEVIQT